MYPCVCVSVSVHPKMCVLVCVHGYDCLHGEDYRECVRSMRMVDHTL